MTGMHRECIHDPRHGLLVRVHVGGRDVLVRSDKVDKLGRVTTRHTLKLADRHLLGIANDPALTTAERNVYDRTFPSHPCGQSFDLVKCHIRGVTNTALRRAASEVVLHAEPFKHLDMPRIHTHGDINFDLTAWDAHHGVEVGIESEQLGCPVETLAHCLKGVFLITSLEAPHFVCHRICHLCFYSPDYYSLSCFIHTSRSETEEIERDVTKSEILEGRREPLNRFGIQDAV